VEIKRRARGQDLSGLSEQQLLEEVARGKNRLIYLWGHLIAVHDGMLPLLDLGERSYPELDATFLTAADRAVALLPSRVAARHGHLLPPRSDDAE
jgi:hypothetical protein